MSKFSLPTETIELPSKGLLYPEDSELAKGTIEMKYMTAKEEDILTNQSYIQKGTVIDKLIKSLIVSKIDFNQLLIGDKNAIMVAARILGYGSKYQFTYNEEEHEVDLSLLDNKKIDEKLFVSKLNEFAFKLPHSGNEVTFKILTHKDEMDIARELEGLKKINKDSSPELTTRLKYIIQSVNGEKEKKDIRDFVDNYLLARDSRALREYISKIQPDIDLTFFPKKDGGGVSIPIGLSFFWPDVK
tara:strand:- start:328 stop:1059 length:732 start_codon:yes stop_codon:yes gene_type:complete